MMRRTLSLLATTFFTLSIAQAVDPRHPFCRQHIEEFAQKSDIIFDAEDEAIKKFTYALLTFQRQLLQKIDHPVHGQLTDIRPIMAGGMGVVYQATFSKSGERVALKVAPGTDRLVYRFGPFDQNFFRISGVRQFTPSTIERLAGQLVGTGNLNTPEAAKAAAEKIAREKEVNVSSLKIEVDSHLDENISPPILAHGQVDDLHYAAIKWIEGKNFEDYYHAFYQNDRPQAKPYIAFLSHIHDFLSKLGCAHQKGLLHCDIKGYNTMISESGDLFIVDWGSSLPLGANIPDDKILVFSKYLAPEHFEVIKKSDSAPAQLDQRMEVYQIGRLLIKGMAQKCDSPVSTTSLEKKRYFAISIYDERKREFVKQWYRIKIPSLDDGQAMTKPQLKRYLLLARELLLKSTAKNRDLRFYNTSAMLNSLDELMDFFRSVD